MKNANIKVLCQTAILIAVYVLLSMTLVIRTGNWKLTFVALPVIIGIQADACETTEQGIQQALALAGPEDVVCACGSLYMIGEVRHLLGLC